MFTAVETSVRSAFGGRLGDMISIELLATAPEKQGRGHASALVQSVNALVCAFKLGIDVCG